MMRSQQKLIISQATLKGIAESSLSLSQERLWQAHQKPLTERQVLVVQGAILNNLERYFLGVADRLGNEFEVELVP